MKNFKLEKCISDIKVNIEEFEEQNEDEFYLLKKICFQLTEKYKNNSHNRIAPWAGKAFFNFVCPSKEKLAYRRRLFEVYFKDVCGRAYETFRTVSSKNTGEDVSFNGFCYSAYLHKKSILEWLVELLIYFDEPAVEVHFSFTGSEVAVISKLKSSKIGLGVRLAKLDGESEQCQMRLSIPPDLVDSNINYYGSKSIELIGREDEFTQLRRFLNCDRKFAWFQLAGAAGQGKSRLALELVLESLQDSKWNGGFCYNHEVKRMNMRLESWRPEKPHLIVLDYVGHRTEDISFFFKELVNSQFDFEHPVRLILIERQPYFKGGGDAHLMSPSLDNLADWFFKVTNSDGISGINILNERYEKGLCELTKLEEVHLLSIVKAICKKLSSSALTLEDSEVEETLRHMDITGKPLYAYFLGQEIANGADTKNWSESDLLTAVLHRERTCWWRIAFPNGEPPFLGDDVIAVRLAVLATMLGGLDCQKASEMDLIPNTSSIDRAQANALNGFSIDTLNELEALPYLISSMQPHLLGEWFVLLNFEKGLPVKEVVELAWEYSPKDMGAFILRAFQDFGGSYALHEILANSELHKHDLDFELTIKIGSKALSIFDNIPASLVISFEKAVSLDNPLAMYLLGLCYFDANAVSQDYTVAFELWNRALQLILNNPLVGSTHSFAQKIVHPTVSSIYLEKLVFVSRHDLSVIMLAVANCYYKGLGVEVDKNKATYWTEESLLKRYT